MPYVVVDLETPGVFLRRDRILELAIVNLADDCGVTDEYATLVNPRHDQARHLLQQRSAIPQARTS